MQMKSTESKKPICKIERTNGLFFKLGNRHKKTCKVQMRTCRGKYYISKFLNFRYQSIIYYIRQGYF